MSSLSSPRRPRLLASRSSRLLALTCGLGLSSLALGLSAPPPAEACGCFAPPDPSVPIVQAGERILFAHKDGVVTAHIQIQYQGKPGDFGWLLPLPAVPTDRNGKDGIELGVDELFTQLISTTQPKYRMNRVYEQCGSGLSRNAAFGASEAAGSAADGIGADMGAPPQAPTPLVIKDSIGPYDYAVLKADSKDLMFNWLKDNKYFVPTGTEGAVNPYIRPGAYFLALKLKAGLSAGDLQPVVLRYKSDLPMIPIILTSVAATPNMGVQVWMLGAGRAIPRNFYHTVINDAQIDWLTAGRNYNDVIIKAVGEAEGKHAFVTEFAGSPQVMRGVLDRPGRFDALLTLTSTTDPVTFVEKALGMFVLNSQLTTLLSRALPLPSALAATGVTPATYYQQIRFYLQTDRVQHPEKYTDIAASLADFPNQARPLADDLRTKIAEPTLDAAALFNQHSTMTRLYSTLSPEDMNKDPVFSYNPSLPPYPNEHTATLTYHCGGFFSSQRYSSATLELPSGLHREFSIDQVNGGTYPAIDAPYSEQIQILRETGEPEIVVDNSDAIRRALGLGGCSLTGITARSTGSSVATSLSLLLGAGALVALRGARRRRASR